MQLERFGGDYDYGYLCCIWKRLRGDRGRGLDRNALAARQMFQCEVMSF